MDTLKASRLDAGFMPAIPDQETIWFWNQIVRLRVLISLPANVSIYPAFPSANGEYSPNRNHRQDQTQKQNGKTKWGQPRFSRPPTSVEIEADPISPSGIPRHLDCIPQCFERIPGPVEFEVLHQVKDLPALFRPLRPLQELLQLPGMDFGFRIHSLEQG